MTVTELVADRLYGTSYTLGQTEGRVAHLLFFQVVFEEGEIPHRGGERTSQRKMDSLGGYFRTLDCFSVLHGILECILFIFASKVLTPLSKFTFFSFSKGNLVNRKLVRRLIALVIAGAMTGTPSSPVPVGGSEFFTKLISILGASGILNTGWLSKLSMT